MDGPTPPQIPGLPERPAAGARGSRPAFLPNDLERELRSRREFTPRGTDGRERSGVSR